MLIISRKPKQVAILRDENGKEFRRIVISKVRGNIVVLGIDLPKNINIIREELEAKERK